MTALTEIDQALDALGAPPEDVGALIARHGGDDRALERVDELLNALGEGVEPGAALPPEARISVDIASVGSEDDALPAALGGEASAESEDAMPIDASPDVAEEDVHELDAEDVHEVVDDVAIEAADEAVDDVAMDVAVPSEPPPPATPSIAADPLAAPKWSPPSQPAPEVRARFDALFEPGAEAAPEAEAAAEAEPVAARDSVRPREELDRLLDQELDPSEFPRSSDSGAPADRVVEDADSSMEMLVDDDDILEIDDVDLEEID